jgi:hypothetical protein
MISYCCPKQIDKNWYNKDNFIYYIDFYPAFLHPCRIEITKKEQLGQIKLIIFNVLIGSDKLYPILSDSALLNNADFKEFSMLDTISLISMKSNVSIGLDGIGVKNFYCQDTMQNNFYFWSPQKGMPEHKIVEVIIGLLRKKFTSLKHQEYIEQLEQYYDFGLPCKRIKINPFEIRIYGSLTAKHEDELNNFINELPSDKSIVVDMTNFNGMGTMYYSLFRSLINRNKNIIWVIKKNKYQLKEIGVDTLKIVDDIELGRYMTEQKMSCIE